MKRIVLTGGGTAGHVSPNQALIPLLLQEGVDIHYIGSAGIEKSLLEGTEGVTYHTIKVGKLRRYFDLKNFTDPFRVISGYAESLRLMRELRPDVVFSKGGYVSLPVVYAAATCRIPVVIHESDLTPGLTTKLCAPLAVSICTTFPECARTLGAKARHTGTPIRPVIFNGSRERALAMTGFTGQKPVLLMMGGSLGAQTVNAVLRESLPVLLTDFDVLHICGRGNLDPDCQGKPGYFQVEYLNEELCDAYALADILLSRAGSNSLSEILAVRKPALLIPYHSGRGDQVLNAESLRKRGLANVLPQGEMTAYRMVTELRNLYNHRDVLQRELDRLPDADGTQAVLEEIHAHCR